MPETPDDTREPTKGVEIISTVDLRDRRGDIIRAVKEEQKSFIIRARKNFFAKLTPYEQDLLPDSLSQEQLEKLTLVEDLTPDELKEMIHLWRHELKDFTPSELKEMLSLLGRTAEIFGSAKSELKEMLSLLGRTAEIFGSAKSGP